MTRYQKLPSNIKYIRNCDDPDIVDVVLATQDSWPKIVHSKHPFKIYFPQETTKAHKTNLNYWKVPYEKFKMVLTNDMRILYALPNACYMALFGSQTVIGLERSTPKPSDYTKQVMEPEPSCINEPPEKTRNVSLLASRAKYLSGHKLRHRVANEIKGVDIFGTVLGGAWTYPENAYLPYRFNIAIENSSYAWWSTEKIFNCFACKTVPIYWGCQGDLSMLHLWGFDTKGVITWNGQITMLKDILEKVNDEYYQSFMPMVQKNYERQKDLACFERALALLCIGELNGLTAQTPNRIIYDTNNKYYRRYVRIRNSWTRKAFRKLMDAL